MNGQSTILFNGPTTLSVNSARPLADMLARIQQLYKVPVNFEEAPYADPTELKASNAMGANGRRTLAPVGGQFQVVLDEKDTDADSAVQTVVMAYTASGLPGRYQVMQREGSVAVVPVQAKAIDGQMHQISPIMETPITLTAEPRPTLEALNLLAAAIFKSTGAKIYVSTVGIPESHITNQGASGEPAEEVLSRILGDPAHIAFQALYDPNGKAYYLNIAPIPAFVPAGNTAKKKVLSPPQNSPFFTKSK